MAGPGSSVTVKDSGGIPSPQFWDNVVDAYEYLYGDSVTGELFSSGVHIVPANSGGYVQHQQVKSSSGVFFGVYGQYSGSVSAWIMVFDSTGPTTGATPLASTAVPAASGTDVNWFISPSRPYIFSHGLYVGLSSTGGTFTPLASLNLSFTTEYV